MIFHRGIARALTGMRALRALCVALAVLSAGRSLAQDLEQLRKAAEAGMREAQYELARRYASGEGVTADPAEALRWYTAAARQGDADAQNNLGALYATGQGVEMDVAKAWTWFEVATEFGSADAVHNRDIMGRKLGPEALAEAQREANALYVEIQPRQDSAPVLRVPPDYPVHAQENHIRGCVVVEFTISADGAVTDPKIVQSIPPDVFDASALAAIRQWRYRPFYAHGSPVERANIRTTLEFLLDEGEGKPWRKDWCPTGS